MAAVGSPPTVRRRQLGRELRRLREESGLLAEELAERLRCSASRISRIETARVRITPGTVHEILDVLSIDGPERNRLVNLARAADEQGWWQPYTEALPYEYATYIALESEAATLRVFEPIIVYGLLQTEEYARAVIEQGAQRRPPAEVKARVATRLARQDILRRADPPTVHVVLDESVLHHVIGGREVLRAQLRYLVELARRPTVTIQVLPFESAAPLALLASPMVMMDFADPGAGPIMYLENMAGGLYIERPEVIAATMTVYERLCAAALNPERSVELIESLV